MPATGMRPPLRRFTCLNHKIGFCSGVPLEYLDKVSFQPLCVPTRFPLRRRKPKVFGIIRHDDAEYSLRVRKYSKFLVVTNAVLNHKTKQNATTYPRRYNWKDYYAVRNRIWMLREHGTLADRFVNWMDLFVNVIFRNWLFGLVKRDSYDWKNEKDMVKKAVRDADKLNM